MLLRDDTVIGTILWWLQGDSAALGMVIVDAGHRRQGLGKVLVSAAMDALGDRRVLLCATSDGAPGYRRAGFSACGQVDQHTGVPTDVVATGAVIEAVPAELSAI